jgi:hypothetical protein
MEVDAALREIGADRALRSRGRARSRTPRSSAHWRIASPDAARAGHKHGFSSTTGRALRRSTVWDHLWRTSPYWRRCSSPRSNTTRPRVRRRAAPRLWPVVRHGQRVDNWCHCDGLSSLYSDLAREPVAVYPQLKLWNRAPDVWLRRISIVSLIHYSGKNAVSCRLDARCVVTACLDGRARAGAEAVGWVLPTRERLPNELRAYLEKHAQARAPSRSRARSSASTPPRRPNCGRLTGARAW